MNKFKLNHLSDQKLAEKQMNSVMGGVAPGGGTQAACAGGWCCCGCLYEGQGGSSTMDNAKANNAGGLYTASVCK